VPAYPTPSFSTVRMWAAISGLLYSVSCIARAIWIGTRSPAYSMLVTTVSSIPVAAFGIVFGVAGSVLSRLRSAA
jgi:hypothetical protein